ncbi:MAG: efflux RND transporter periplasmic adaptor subunit [Vicinamibacteria bacterium]
MTRTRHLASALVLLAAAGCGSPAAPPEDTGPAAGGDAAIALTAEAERAAGIELTPVRRVERTDALVAPGVVALDERRTARPGALVEGVVMAIDVVEGDVVRRGALLARLHSHVLHDAWAAYFTALAEVRRREHELGYAREAEARAARLVADKALSVQEAARATADRVAAEETLVMARAEVTRAEQELHHYGVTPDPGADPDDREGVPVTTPVAGVVVERLASPGAAVTPGVPLFVVSDLASVWVIAQVDERQVARLARGAAATVAVAAYPGETFAGTVEAIGDVVDPTSRRITVRVSVANADRRLKPQMFASVALGAGAPRAVLAVPTRAVQQIEGETVVFVKRADGRFHRQTIAAGADVDGWVEVLSGLAEGDEVVSAGAFLLKSELVGVGDEEP